MTEPVDAISQRLALSTLALGAASDVMFLVGHDLKSDSPVPPIAKPLLADLLSAVYEHITQSEVIAPHLWSHGQIAMHGLIRRQIRSVAHAPALQVIQTLTSLTEHLNILVDAWAIAHFKPCGKCDACLARKQTTAGSSKLQN